MMCGCLCTQLHVPDQGAPGSLPDPTSHLSPECSPLQPSLGWAWLPQHLLPVSPSCLFLQVALSLKKSLSLPRIPASAALGSVAILSCPLSYPSLCFWYFPPYSVSLPLFPWFCFYHSASTHLSLLGSISVTSSPIHSSLLPPTSFTPCHCAPPSSSPWL